MGYEFKSIPHSLAPDGSDLFVEALQFHLQSLQEALPLAQLTLSPPQSFITLTHLRLHPIQLQQ